MQSIARAVFCLSAFMSRKQHVQTSQNFVHELPGAMAQSSAIENEIRYVLPLCG